ncbi:sulfurtransferase [Sphingomonas radiodurans]|uniref:sulfurtransferase n=1 Tax=Sphingomonas radiodurans TaxID=2890321 RepID=UPI001E384A80|nr:sulfurtransferase [Sphingomonas radiodurans]WBH17508.1 sulfurtransferase [Sphingomonas radiodurans]
MDALVTTQWLADELDARDLRIADCSWFLPNEQRDAAAEHALAHIPGAVFLDLAEIADTASDVPMMLPPPEKFASRMARLGLGDGTRIILYDDSPLRTAARAWAMLRSFGVTDVALLDGGLAKWRAEGRPLASEPRTPKPRHITARTQGAGIRDLAYMKANLTTATDQIVDARSPSRFAGTEPEPRPDIVPGHIPGASNLPYARFFHPDGTWKRDADLSAVFTDAGIDLDRPIVATCGSGVTASVIAFAAHLLGREVPVYDGSWSEWGADPTTPKETGA